MQLLLSLSLPLLALSAPPSLPPELETFLGPPPAGFAKNFLKPAEQLRKALEKMGMGKTDQAIKALRPLAAKGEMAEHASAELAHALREKKEFAQSTSLAQKTLSEYPATPYENRLEDLLRENDCDHGLLEATKAKKTNTPALRSSATGLLFRCLQRTPWRQWADRGEQAEALFDLLKKSKSPLFGAFVTELIQALPSSAPLRARIQKEIPEKELRAYSSVARFRIKSPSPGGVKAVYPDLDLFNEGIQAALEGKWPDANDRFKRVVAEYPQSEHLDRAQYWIARSEAELGRQEEARLRYQQIFQESPLSYYGLQSALKLERDLSLFVVPASGKIEPIDGALLPRQMLALWRLRALLEEGLLDPARMEAQALFQHRPGGFTFGQESPSGAALVALLYHTAGYSLAAFSHAYAAITLDPQQLNAFTLELIFPSRYSAELTAAAESSGVHPLLLASVTKQESAFLPNAISRANALGLMQLLLSTARDMKPKLQREDLFEPSVNTAVGARYLQRLLDRFDGNIALALAGYNAGPSRAAQWQKKMLEFEGMKKSFDVDLFIDSIPFTETRRYVGAILRNYAWYKLLNKDDSIKTVEELVFQWQNAKTQETPNPAAPENTENPAPDEEPLLDPLAPPEELSPPTPPIARRS